MAGVLHIWTEENKQLKLMNFFSEEGFVAYGVPQGSVLCPVLFLVYINKLCEAKLNGKVTAFADDAALTYSHSDSNQIQLLIDEDLKTINVWFEKQFLPSSGESKYMTFNIRKDVSLNEDVIYHTFKCS